MRASVLPVVCERVRGQVSVLLDGELSRARAADGRRASGALRRLQRIRGADVRAFTEEIRGRAGCESPARPIVVRRTARVSLSARVQASAAREARQLASSGSRASSDVDRAGRARGRAAAAANLFTASWQPELELAQIEPVESVPEPERPARADVRRSSLGLLRSRRRCRAARRACARPRRTLRARLRAGAWEQPERSNLPFVTTLSVRPNQE